MSLNSRLKIYRIVPGGPSRGDLLREFASKGGDLVAFSGPALKAHATSVEQGVFLNPMLFGAWVRKCAVAVGVSAMKLTPDSLFEEAVGVAMGELPDDSPFAAARRFPGTRRAVARALGELSSAGIDAQGLGELVGKTEGPLQAKLRSLASAASRVEAICRDLGYGSMLEYVEECAPLKTAPGAPMTRTLLIVGNEWSPVAERFCRWFCDRGGSLTMLLDCHASGQSAPFETAETVLQAFPEASLSESSRAPVPFLCNLFGGHPGQPVEGDFEVTVLAAPDPLAESEEVVRGLLAAMEEGLQPSELAVFARDLELYGVPLDTASRRMGVPLSLARRAPLRSNGWIRFLLATLDALAGADVRALLRPIASSYLGMSEGDRITASDRVREAFREGGEAWTALGDSILPERLSRLLAWRRQATADRFTLAEWLGLLADLRNELRPDSSDHGPTVERDARAHSALTRTLIARVSVENLSGGIRLSLAGFARTCRETAANLDVSVPAGHGIAVVSDPEGLASYERVWAMGLLEGQFPRRRSEDPILHDMDREALAALGVKLRNSVDRARAERSGFYRVASAARSRLTLSYPETDEDRDNIPAFYLEEARRAGGARAKFVRKERSDLAPPLELCANEADRSLRVALDGPRTPLPPVEFQTEVPMFALGRSPSDEPTVKDLRDITRCPFQYFGRRLLGLRSTQMARRWAALRQLPVRTKLASQRSPEAARQAMRAELEEEITRIMPDAADWEISGFRAGGMKLIEEWVEREFEARRIWRNGEVRHEVALQQIDPEGGFRKLAVGGVAPAITEFDNRRVLHLYEGRQPELDDSGFKDKAELLYYGVHLLATYHPESKSMAVEIESQRDGRKMLFIPRMPNATARPTQRMTLKDLSQSDHAAESIRLFSRDVRSAIQEAKDRLRTLSVLPTPGDHCTWCDLGELCRRSAKFSEEPDPFERREFDEED